MIVLGMDLSLNGTGFAVVEHKDDGTIFIHETCYRVVELCFVNNKGKYAKLSHGDRLKRIADELIRILNTYKIDIVVREKGFTRFNKATQVLYKVHGVIDYILALYGQGIKEVDPVSPTTIKKQIAGTGKADKILVMQGLDKYVGHLDYETNDLSDATACAVYALEQIYEYYKTDTQ